MISVKINVTKVDKSKLFQGKNGSKWLDILLIESRNDKYGNDYMVVEGVSREDRERGVRGAILGNAKVIGKQAPKPSASSHAPAEGGGDDVPF